MNCTQCMAYPTQPEAKYCALGKRLDRPALTACGVYSERDPTDSTAIPVRKVSPPCVEIPYASRSWRVFHNMIQALYKSGGISSKTATYLLDTLEGQEEDRSSTLTHWYREQAAFQDAGLSPIGSRGRYLFWHEALDRLRDLFLAGQIDIDCLLAALDFERDTSPTVADLVDIWSVLRQAREDSEDVFDHPAYQEPEVNLPFQ